jgi:hypothetical protein
MNPLSPEIWRLAVAYPDYRAGVTRNQEAFDEAYAHPGLEPGDFDLLRALPPLRILAIGEDWCPDVFNTLPTWVRITEMLPRWDLRVLARDAHPEVMAHFLWKDGAQRIPVYAFYNEAGRLQVWWSGRSAEAEDGLEELLAGRKYGDLTREEQKQMGAVFEESYRKEYRRANFEEMLRLLAAFFHVR